MNKKRAGIACSDATNNNPVDTDCKAQQHTCDGSSIPASKTTMSPSPGTVSRGQWIPTTPYAMLTKSATHIWQLRGEVFANLAGTQCAREPIPVIRAMRRTFAMHKK